uniref:Ion_trans domain-containing protein n=1 Tax=Macrostomum lignano TaxID=282301 RepID=A0A1I8F779_9PLAT
QKLARARKISTINRDAHTKHSTLHPIPPLSSPVVYLTQPAESACLFARLINSIAAPLIHRAGVSAEELGSRRLSNRTQDLQQQRQQQQAEEEEERQRQRQHDKRRDSFCWASAPGRCRIREAKLRETGEKPRLAERIRLRMRCLSNSCTIAQPPCRQHRQGVRGGRVASPFLLPLAGCAVRGLAACYNLIFIVMRSAFTQISEEYRYARLVPARLCGGCPVYAVDVFLSVLGRGLLVRDLPRLRQVYMQSAGFKLDLACLFPTDVLYCVPQIGIVGTYEFIDRNRDSNQFSNCFRISKISDPAGGGALERLHSTSPSAWCWLGRDSWTYRQERQLHRPGEHRAVQLLKPYGTTCLESTFYSFFWSTMILTTIGDVPRPVTDFEYAFMTWTFLVGVLILRWGWVEMFGSMITNMKCSEDRSSRCGWMGSNARVIRWFDYLCDQQAIAGRRRIPGTLPDKLKAEIAIHVHFDTLKRVAIFQDCEPGLLVELGAQTQAAAMQKVKCLAQGNKLFQWDRDRTSTFQVVYSPGDYICRKGRHRQGDVHSETRQAQRGLTRRQNRFRHLGEGSVFGEVGSILNIRATRRAIGAPQTKERPVGGADEYPDAKVQTAGGKGQQVLTQRQPRIDEEALAKALARCAKSTGGRVERLNAELGVTASTRFAGCWAEFGSTQKQTEARDWSHWRTLPRWRCGPMRQERRPKKKSDGGTDAGVLDQLTDEGACMLRIHDGFVFILQVLKCAWMLGEH